MQSAGMKFSIASNNRPENSQVHPRMREIQSEVYYLSSVGLGEVFAAHAHALFQNPLRYLLSLVRLPFSGETFFTAAAQLTGAALLLSRFSNLPKLHLHAHFTYGAAGVALWANRLAGTTYSLTLHGSDLIYDNPPDLEERLSHAESIISISRFNVDFLHEHFPKIRPRLLEIIRMGISLKEPAPPHSPRGAHFRILNVGRLSEHKAQHCLIEACALLKERGLVFVCDIVGEGELRSALEQQIAELHLEDCVRLLGPRFHDEVLALYGETDLFVLSSITEGQPIVLMEAMRAGVPLIATSISAIPELVQDGGLLVAPNDPLALAKAIQEVAEGKVDTQKMVSRAQDILTAEYDLEANHQRFKAFIEALP